MNDKRVRRLARAPESVAVTRRFSRCYDPRNVHFLYGAVRNAVRCTRQNGVNGLEPMRSRDLSAKNSRTVSVRRQSPIRKNKSPIVRQSRLFERAVHAGSSQFTSDHFRPPRIADNHRVSSAVVERHCQQRQHILVPDRTARILLLIGRGPARVQGEVNCGGPCNTIHTPCSTTLLERRPIAIVDSAHVVVGRGSKPL